ncbi:transcription factor bHLH128-like protein [Carex littledalei]|uniref:Transcription factor bHLH128-like protein n=1 Tax=Carex littledalei TaxID=544730 RepID=A0A833R0P2_9POAL|nr:transcription factor bHLH128-like protein [Carex littledalei]
MNRFNPNTGKPEPMGPPGLTRYGSAPGSLLASIADSVINSQGRTRGGGGSGEFSVVGSEPMMSRFYPGEPTGLTSSDSSCRTGSTANGSYAFGGVPDLSGSHKTVAEVHPAPSLVRHSSSPAGLLSHLLVDPQGLSGTKGMGGYSHATTETVDLLTDSRLRPQWSFSRQDSLSQLSEMSIPDMGEDVKYGVYANASGCRHM